MQAPELSWDFYMHELLCDVMVGGDIGTIPIWTCLKQYE